MNSGIPSPSLGSLRPWPDGFGSYTTVTAPSWANLDDNTSLGSLATGVSVDSHDRFHLGNSLPRAYSKRWTEAARTKWSEGLDFLAPRDRTECFTIGNVSFPVSSKGKRLSTDGQYNDRRTRELHVVEWSRISENLKVKIKERQGSQSMREAR